jgi:hypothetical protein
MKSVSVWNHVGKYPVNDDCINEVEVSYQEISEVGIPMCPGCFTEMDFSREIFRGKKPKVAWNKEKTSSVVLSKIKSFTIKDISYLSQSSLPIFQVKGWFNDTNSFVFGDFTSEEEAQKFLDENVHSLY